MTGCKFCKFKCQNTTLPWTWLNDYILSTNMYFLFQENRFPQRDKNCMIATEITQDVIYLLCIYNIKFSLHWHYTSYTCVAYCTSVDKEAGCQSNRQQCKYFIQKSFYFILWHIFESMFSFVPLIFFWMTQ